MVCYDRAREREILPKLNFSAKALECWGIHKNSSVTEAEQGRDRGQRDSGN